jgi:radical SAM protein with 4Fe4S-binding SPASM domain
LKTEKYILDSCIILRSEPQYYDTYVAYNWEKSEPHFLTREEHSILNLIYNEPKTVTEVADSSNVSEDFCKNFLNNMKNKGLIQIYKKDIRAPPRTKVNGERFQGFKIPFLSGPTAIDLFITSRCNLRCRHCFSDSGEETHELPLNLIKNVLDQLESMRVLEVRINGGEPFSHPEIDEILADISDRRLRRVIITNGTLLDRDKVQLLKRSKTIPTVSLDDSIPEGHDDFRGVKGSFEQTLKGMSLLKQGEVVYGVNTCIHRGNMKRVKDIIDLAAKYGASKIALLDLKEVGRLREHKEIVPSPAEYRRASIGLELLKRMMKDIEVSLDVFMKCYPLRESMMEKERGYVSCSAGKTRLSIGSDGFVYPCNIVLSDEKWSMGDIRESSLKDIWFSNKWRLLRGGIRFKELEKCPSCPSRNECHELYCRLYPYMKTGDLYALNPYCKRKK